MDSQSRKAVFRKKLAEKKEKRIDSPLVRYNEFDQPVCKVCNVVLKSDSVWDAHQVSSKHREAVNKLKAQASGLNPPNNVRPDSCATLPAPKESKAENIVEPTKMKIEPPSKLSKPQASSGLPPDFFDNNDSRQKHGTAPAKLPNSDSKKKFGIATPTPALVSSYPDDDMDEAPDGNTKQLEMSQPTQDLMQSSRQASVPGAKQVKGSLPEGFFDNKEADLRARGVKLVKPDVKDEYKEFEKLIQEDLQEVDNRMEEEEIDAAEMIEEAESVEQRTYREKVEMLKRKKLELMASRSAKRSKGSEASGKESSNAESSSDDDTDENFTVDWRAQHL